MQISTDEVYGSVAGGIEPRDRRTAAAESVLGEQGRRRPAGLQLLGDLQRAGRSITRASNNYGPYQFPEKVIPLFITNAIDNIPVPLYGDGPAGARLAARRRIIAARVDLLIDAGASGEVYNVGGGNHVRNIDLTQRILELVGKPSR